MAHVHGVGPTVPEMNDRATRTSFIPGQRWVSATEADLGLGIVESNADRRVVIVFPAKPVN